MSVRRWVIALAIGGAASLALGITGLYVAGRHVPDFYEAALDAQAVEQQSASDEFLTTATAVTSRVQHAGRWSAVITADQINGWLAVDVPQNHPTLLPTDVADPRIRLTPEHATIACRWNGPTISTVVSLDVAAYLAEPNVLALRIDRLRAGAVPLPLDQLLEAVTQFATDADLPLRWRKAHGNPVALITLPSMTRNGTEMRLDSIEFRDGELYIAGTTAALNGQAGTDQVLESIANTQR